MTDEIKFNFPALQNAYDKAKVVLVQYAVSLDQMSADIKALENYLGSLPILNDFDYECYSAEHKRFGLYWHFEGKRLLCYYQDDSHYIRKPLIECPACIRKELYPFLGPFLDKLAAR